MPLEEVVSRYVRLLECLKAASGPMLGSLTRSQTECQSRSATDYLELVLQLTELQSRRTGCDAVTSKAAPSPDEPDLNSRLTLIARERATFDSPGDATRAAWKALTMHHASEPLLRPEWKIKAADVFDQLVAGRSESGFFYSSVATLGVEVGTYYELATLHAFMSYAAATESQGMLAIAGELATLHCAETQPDHSTSEPWAIHAMIWNPASRPLADMMLHAHQIQQPTRPDGVASLLLADALYCLRRLNGEDVA